MDDEASTFHSTFGSVSFTLNPDLTDAERGELAVEVQFYGLLRLMMPTEVPYYAQEQIGMAILQRACDVGTKGLLQLAVALARALVFEMGSTSPWLTAEFQDSRYVIANHIVNGEPVWAAEDGVHYMYRARSGEMWISDEANCAAGTLFGCMYNTVSSPHVLAPTQLPSNFWKSGKRATLGPKYPPADGSESPWVWVPHMRVTAVHGLDDADPAMAAALRQLTALTAVE